jgi:hypothetical protein
LRRPRVTCTPPGDSESPNVWTSVPLIRQATIAAIRMVRRFAGEPDPRWVGPGKPHPRVLLLSSEYFSGANVLWNRLLTQVRQNASSGPTVGIKNPAHNGIELGLRLREGFRGNACQTSEPSRLGRSPMRLCTYVEAHVAGTRAPTLTLDALRICKAVPGAPRAPDPN